MCKKIVSVFLAVFLLVCVVSGCARPKVEEKLRIVTTVFPLYDFARAVAGENAQITLLIDPGTEVHSYEPKPSDILAVQNCDLFLKVGGESEKWAQRVVSDSKVETLSLIETAKVSGHEHSGDKHHHNHQDEHIWTSPTNAIAMVKEISQAIIKVDKENSDIYLKNAEDYISQIEKAAEKIKASVEEMPEKHILVADRFPFLYFAKEFGLKYDAAFGGCAASADISVKTMNQLVQKIEQKQIKKVYYIELSNKEIANALSEETGVNTVLLHSAHNVSAKDFNDGKTYVDIMNSNAEALKK